MISTIQIKNIGIIDYLSINLENGFNILTGETGAGKTLIIDSLSILCGNRFSKEMIRKGEEYSYIEASIYMPENKNAIDGNIIVSREIYNNGRNSCKINGRLVTVSELKEFMETIIDIHGQHDNQTLLNKSSHIGYLDSFIGNEMSEIKAEYRALYETYQQITTELKHNYGDETEKQRKLDLLNYQLNEIKQAALKQGEDETLEEQRKRMLNAEKIVQNLEIADHTLTEQAIDNINTAIRALEKIEDIDEEYSKKLTELKNIYYDIQEIARDISIAKEEVCFEEEERNEIEERLDTIFSLKRKYGNSIAEILNYQQKIEKEIYEIENLDEINHTLKKQLTIVQEKMAEQAKKMNQLRTENAKKLAEKINEELQDLEMKHAKFNAKIELNKENQFHKNGLDDVEFLISTNIGEEEKPLSKIASGGEMSRIMLAIKSVLADVDQVPILIFDEIDTGISGIAAKAVAQKMKKIAKTHQILCITHLASIAAQGDYHYYISKEVEHGKTRTKIEKLNEENRLKEIARIASGDINDISIEHAKQLRTLQ